jgi:hypothetical protein
MNSEALLQQLREENARLAEVVQRAARRVGTPLSTRGKGLHANARWSAPSATIPSLTLSWQGSDRKG